MTTFRLQRHGELWLEFDGELLAEASSDDGEKDHYQVLRLYRTSGGIYVLERLGETRVPGEVVMRYVDDFTNAYQVRKRLERKRDDDSVYYTIVALELLDAAAEVDDAFKAAAAERIG